MPPMLARTSLLVFLALSFAACAAVQPLSPGAPRRNQPPYPVVLADKTQRTEAASAAWAQLTHQQGISGKPVVSLQPITATIRNLPDYAAGHLYLPKVGTSAQMSEEETREALRRFLSEWKALLGAEPSQLSLVNETTNADGTKTAHYEQRPFSYPLRGEYGKIDIRFAADRRVPELSSTAIPDSERIQAALSAAQPVVTADEIPKKLIGRTVSYGNSSGQHTYTI